MGKIALRLPKFVLLQNVHATERHIGKNNYKNLLFRTELAFKIISNSMKNVYTYILDQEH